ncbi:MAG: alpha/beta hydrolase [Clostridia bacterium]|nr:alpha/beta hydrolase [Clostridia bacterium]
MSIIRTEAYYNSTTGEDMIRALIWRNDELPPMGVVQISHGLTDHIDRYDRFARFLAENGYVVCGNDHLGHGKAAAEAGKLGDFGNQGTDIRMVDDMNKLAIIMKKKYADMPYYLLGHSMGSFLARLYAAQFGEGLSGLILCGTTHLGGKISMLSEWVLPFGEMIGADKYSDTGSEVLGKITARYFREDDESAWLSVSRENRDEALNDPYFDYPITNASAMMVAKILLRASADECYAGIPQGLPVMLISGGKDPIGFFGRGVLSVCDKYDVNGADTFMKIYPGLRHEILNEDDYESIYTDVLEWINDNNFYTGEFI